MIHLNKLRIDMPYYRAAATLKVRQQQKHQQIISYYG